MKLSAAQVLGLNTDQKAAQVIFSQQDQENAFLSVLDLTCDDAFTKGRQVLSELSDFYFDFEGSPIDKLKATFDEASKLLSKDEFFIVLAAFSGKVLYLVGQGEVEASLKRANEISPLLNVGSAGQVISGFLEEGDRILFSTKSLDSFLGNELNKSLELPLETFEEEITSKIGSEESQVQGLAGIIVDVEGEKESAIASLTREEKALEDGAGDKKSLEGGHSFSKAGFLLKGITNILSQFRRLGGIFPKSGVGKLILAIILIVIIIAGIGLNYKRSKDQEKEAQFNQYVQIAGNEFEAAKGLKNLNPSEAKNKLEAAKSSLGKALALKPNDQRVKNLQNQIDAEESSILQQFETLDFPVFLDLSLAKEGFQAKRMSLSNGNILLLDPETKTLLTINISKKSNDILAGEEQLGEASLAVLNSNFAYTYSDDKGVIKTDGSNQKQTEVAKPDDEWGEIVDIGSFGSNAYILDSRENQIWKYVPVSTGYANKAKYLNDGVNVEFTNVFRMQIDSSVYIMKSDGEILKFTRGNKDSFSYQGLDQGVKEPKGFFVSSDTDNLYVLDSGNSRVLILGKEGLYKGQIAGNKFAAATDLVIDEGGKKVYLLDGSKIYAIDLQTTIPEPSVKPG